MTRLLFLLLADLDAPVFVDFAGADSPAACDVEECDPGARELLCAVVDFLCGAVALFSFEVCAAAAGTKQAPAAIAASRTPPRLRLQSKLCVT